MIIWSGFGIIIPIIAIIGMIVGSIIASAVGYNDMGLGLGLGIAAFANWGVWKMVYPKSPRVLVDQASGRQVLMNPKHGLFFIPARAWTWLLAILAIPVLVVSVIGGRSEAEEATKPGYKEFETANELIGSSSKGMTHGNSASARDAAVVFSRTMKEMIGAFFSGGSKKNLLTDGNFLTYCHAGPETVVFLCHVPSLRSYRSEEAKEGLDSIAWLAARKAVEELEASGERRIVVGLRGMASYGSILSGKAGDDEPEKSQDTSDRSVFFAAFSAANTEPVENAPVDGEDGNH